MPRPAPAAWLALGLFLAARFLLLPFSDALLLIPEQDADSLYNAAEAQHRLSIQPSPRVIILGTSRLGILSPDCVAEQWGISTQEVANFSIAGNNFWRSALLFRRNPELLDRVDAIILDIFPFQLYTSILFTEEDPFFLRLASIEDRWMVRDPLARFKAFSDLAVPLWSERHNLVGWLQAPTLLRPTPRERSGTFLRLIQDPGSAREPGATDKPERNPQAQDKSSGYAPPPVISQIQVQALRKLIDLMPEGCKLFLVWLPVREDFDAALRQDAALHASYTQFRQHLEELDSPAVESVWLDNPQGTLVARSGFVDEVHYTRQGIATVCTLLGEALRPALDRGALPGVPRS